MINTGVIKSKAGKALSVTGALLMLSACSLNGDRADPVLTAGGGYGEIEGKSRLIVMKEDATRNEGEIIKAFNDEKLEALIREALSNAQDIKSAYLNIKSAAAASGLADTAFMPDYSLTADERIRKDFDKGDKSYSSSVGFTLSYEADLFGRLDAESRAAFSRYQASAYDYLAVRLSIIRRTAEYYWQYAAAKEALDLAGKQLENSFKRLEIIKHMTEAGAADPLEYDRAEVNHKIVEQNVYQKEYELNNAHYALCILLGKTADYRTDQLISDTALADTHIFAVETALPSSLLKNRPDLMALEERLRASLADNDAAAASFWPTFNISASLSTGSAESLGRLLLNPAGALGAALTFPFLNYNELKLKEEQSLIASEKAATEFVDGFIQAVAETAEAVNTITYKERQLKSTRAELTLSRKNYERYLERYREGEASLSDVLDASDTVRNAEIKRLNAKRDLLTAEMTLLTSLGTGLSAEEKSADRIMQEAEQTVKLRSDMLSL